MIKTTQASPDGMKVIPFFEGKEYTLSPQLARALAGSYEVVVEEKNEGRAPSNKAARPREDK